MNIIGLRGIASALIFAVIMACSSMESNASMLRFCPADEEADARHVLNLGDDSSVELDDLLTRASSLGYNYEVTNADNISRKCDDAEIIPEAQTYKIYAGFDETNTFTRNYLVVAESSGTVRYIEARHSYRAPGFSN